MWWVVINHLRRSGNIVRLFMALMVVIALGLVVLVRIEQQRLVLPLVVSEESSTDVVVEISSNGNATGVESKEDESNHDSATKDDDRFVDLLDEQLRKHPTLKVFVDEQRKRNKCIGIFGSDFHPALIHDLQWLSSKQLFPFCVKVEHHDYSVHCSFFGVCSNLTSKVRIHGALELLEAFHSTYRPNFDSERYSRQQQQQQQAMRDVDIFLVTHPVPHFEYYLAFNKPIIVIQAVPFWFGRPKARLGSVYDVLLRYRGIDFYANNQFHQKQTEWLTDGKLRPTLLGSYCGYLIDSLPNDVVDAFGYAEFLGSSSKSTRNLIQSSNGSKNGSQVIVLGYRPRLVQDLPRLSRAVNATNGRVQLQVVDKVTELVKVDAVVYEPYAPSLMTGFEWSRLPIPMFVRFTHKRQVEFEDLQRVQTKLCESKMNITKDKCRAPFPWSSGRWDHLSDYRFWPHFEFTDEQDLINQLLRFDPHAIRRSIQAHNRNLLVETVMNWTFAIQKAMMKLAYLPKYPAANVTEWYRENGFEMW